MSVEDRVIVLNKVKYAESDLVLHTINRQGTQLNFIARSALKSKKRFGGGILEPTHYLQVTYKVGRNDSELLSLQEATLIDDFAGIRTSYDKLQLAFYFLSLMRKVSVEGEMNNQNNFNLLGHALKCLEKDVPLSQLKSLFEVKFLHYQGVLESAPEFRSLLAAPLSDLVFNEEVKPTLLTQKKISHELQLFLE